MVMTSRPYRWPAAGALTAANDSSGDLVRGDLSSTQRCLESFEGRDTNRTSGCADSDVVAAATGSTP
jgi:hypothetical protein